MPRKSWKAELAARRQERESGGKPPAPVPLDQFPPQLLEQLEPCIYCGSLDLNHMPWDCPDWEKNIIIRRKEECQVCRETDTIHMHHMLRIQAGKAIDFQ